MNGPTDALNASTATALPTFSVLSPLIPRHGAMTPSKIQQSIAECQRFLAIAQSVLDSTSTDGYPLGPDSFYYDVSLGPSRATGRLRRASMDLSQSLIELRRRH